MNTHDIDFELPPLPQLVSDTIKGFGKRMIEKAIKDYARAAIEADRKRKGEVVVTKTPEGEIIAVTRQDDEGRILSVIAEAESKRRGEPVYGRWQTVPTHPTIDQIHAGEAAIKKSFLDGETPSCFSIWDAMIKAAPQPAEPVKVPSDADLLAFGAEEQFFLFCDEDEFLDIARALLARYGQPAQPAERAEPPSSD